MNKSCIKVDGKWRMTVEYQKEWRKKYPNYPMEHYYKHRKEIREQQKLYRQLNKAKIKAQNLLRSLKYPLGSECEFCGKTKKLEHGHIDYNFPELYLTVCRECNVWMDKPIKRE